MTDESQTLRLERENAKLRKINRVLMDRVERSMDFQGNAFSLFQTAIVLEGKVRERTAELENALFELEAANLAAEEIRRYLREAIESINEGFLLCDADDRLVLTNSKYREMWGGGLGPLDPGMPFAEVILGVARSGTVRDALADPEAWARLRMESHHTPQEPFVLRMADGRWLQISERRTGDGGFVSLYTDITEIKLSEERRRERELAEKSILLQATLDNLTQGVSVFDGQSRLVAWNQRFVSLLGVPRALAQPGSPLTCFPMQAHIVPDAVAIEVETAHGVILEIRRNPMPGGGFVTTYTDITERQHSEEALRDSERRMRLVTDAMPALIAYVDAHRRYQFTNKGYEDWFGRPRSSINGHQMGEILGAELYGMRAQYVDQALRGEECSFEMTMPTGPAGVQYALANYVPHFGPDGGVLGFFALIQDITERRQAAKQLVEAKESLERRVEERTQELRAANLELSAAKGAAEQANLSKTRFLAAASHDLLQPLNAARVFASALTERRLAPANRSLGFSTLAALDSVDELLTALLDISKLDAGVQSVEPGDFGLAPMLAVLSEEYRMLAHAKRLSLRVCPSTLGVRSDPRLLGRILRNYLSNALRYTQPGGRVLVGCRRNGAQVLVGVWDNGPGIPEDKQEEIFEEFRRLDHRPEGGERGMGLGLAIVRRIARVLDHDLVLRSRPGQGSLFGILMPLAADRSAIPAPPPPPQPAAVARLDGARVAMIDNDRLILAGMTALIEHWGCRAIAGLSQAALWSQWDGDAPPPNLIIADYHLDDGALGLHVIADIRARFGAEIPAIVITADHSDDLQARAQAAGCHLLTKPVRNGKLRSLMAHLLKSRPESGSTAGWRSAPPASGC